MRSSIGGKLARLNQLSHERGFVEQLGGWEFFGDGECDRGAEVFRRDGGPFCKRLGYGVGDFGFGEAGRLPGEGVGDCLGDLALGDAGLGGERARYRVGYLIFGNAGLGGEGLGYLFGDLSLGNARLGGEGLRYLFAHLLWGNAGLISKRFLDDGGYVGGRHALRLVSHRFLNGGGYVGRRHALRLDRLLNDLGDVDGRGRGRHLLRGGARESERGQRD